MDGVSPLERYLERCGGQDDLSTSLQLFTPTSPYDVDLPIQATEDGLFSSQFNQPKDLPTDFSTVDLSFLPDITQDNKEQNLSKDGNEMQEELDGSIPRNEDSSGVMEESSLSYPDATQSSPEASDTCPLTPMSPMTPVTSASESSGIVPQLQNIVSTVNLACKLDLKNIALHARNAEYNPKRFAAVIMRIREPRTTALIFSSGKMVCTGAKSEEQSRLAARKYARVVQKLGFPAKFLDFKIQNMVGSCDVRFPIWLEGLVLTHQQFSRDTINRGVKFIFTGGHNNLLVAFREPNVILGLDKFIAVAACQQCTPEICIYLSSAGDHNFTALLLLPNMISNLSGYEPELFPGLIYRMVKPRIVLLIFVSGKVVLTGAKERSEINEAFENIYPILKGFKKAS